MRLRLLNHLFLYQHIILFILTYQLIFLLFSPSLSHRINMYNIYKLILPIFIQDSNKVFLLSLATLFYLPQLFFWHYTYSFTTNNYTSYRLSLNSLIIINENQGKYRVKYTCNDANKIVIQLLYNLYR